MAVENKIILITGAAKGGIGEAVANYYAANNKIIVSSKNMTSDRIPTANLAIAADCITEEGVKHLEEEILKKYNNIDILINCIGGSLGDTEFEKTSLEFFEKVIKLNLTSSFLLSQMASRLMKKAEEGWITHIVSSSGFQPEIKKLPYAVAKAGQTHLIKSLALVLAPKIIVNGVSPTYVYTDRHLNEIKAKAEKKGITEEEVMKSYVSKQIVPNYLYPDDLIEFIDLSISTKVMTGKILHATGGRVL
jgi:3-oxoacyl-[acyl-carrier protein] reductase